MTILLLQLCYTVIHLPFQDLRKLLEVWLPPPPPPPSFSATVIIDTKTIILLRSNSF